jgi:hypothetical protein
MAGRGLAGACLVAAAVLVLAPSALAAQTLGKFEVTGGHLDQRVEFNSSGVRYDAGTNFCWQFRTSHHGSSDLRLRALDGKVEATTFDDSIILRNIKFAGKQTTTYAGNLHVEPGPEHDPDDCPPPSQQPPLDTSGCGTKKVSKKGRISLTELGNQPSQQAIGTVGGGLGPWGTFPGILDASLECPSDSFWAAAVFPAAGDVKREKLLKSSGPVKITGKRTYSGKSGLLCFCDEGPTGFNNVQIDWSLKLKPIRK